MDLAGRFQDFNHLQKAAFLVAGVLIGSTVVFLFLNADTATKQEVGQELVNTLENQSGQNLELVSVNQQNGLYEVNMKNQEDRLITYYTTRDGELFTSSVTSMSDLKTYISARNSFRNCLSDKGVVMYGNVSQRNTVAQIQLLGGQQVAQPIYRDISNQEALEEAVSRGIQRVPAFYYNGTARQGVNTLSQLEQFTGCGMNAE